METIMKALTHAAMWLMLVSVGMLSASPAPDNPASGSTEVKTGGSRMITVYGKYQVWTKKVGSGKIKVLLLHGGPGFNHEYFECFEDFFPQAGIEFYYYDQLGSSYSDQPTDTTLWTVDRFRDEVEQVRQGLGLDNFYLFGHSWGGMLAMEYAFKYQQHLKGLVISDMTASIESYEKYTHQLRASFPPEIIQKLDQYEKEKNYDAPEYQDIIMNQLYTKYICRLDPWPEPLQRCFKHYNPQVYNTMQGPNEFVITGNLKNWNVWDKLPSIKVPTLVTGAKYDTMNPEDIKREGELIPHSRVLICDGSHISMYDDQQNYFTGLIKFLKDVDSGTF
jgi:proline iminopeptidase